MIFDLRSEDGGTRVDVRNESEPPGPEFVGKLTDPLVAPYLRRKIDSMLQDVKMIVEETLPGPVETRRRCTRVADHIQLDLK